MRAARRRSARRLSAVTARLSPPTPCRDTFRELREPNLRERLCANKAPGCWRLSPYFRPTLLAFNDMRFPAGALAELCSAHAGQAALLLSSARLQD
ncbi:hypothetical protein MRX96_019085 [Rhipicephalus microplus]